MGKVKAIVTSSSEFYKVKELFKFLDLEERSLYLVRVKTDLNSEEHKSFLFTGNKSGENSMIFNLVQYDRPIRLEKILSIQVIKKIDDLI